MLDTGILQTANWPNLFSAADQVLPHLHCHPTTHLRAQATNWGNTLSITHPTETAPEAGPCPQRHLESTLHLPTHNLSEKEKQLLSVNELKKSKDISYGFAYLSMKRYWNDFRASWIDVIQKSFSTNMGLFYSIFAKHCFTLQLVNMYLTKELLIITVKKNNKKISLFLSPWFIFFSQDQFILQVLKAVFIATFIQH